MSYLSERLLIAAEGEIIAVRDSYPRIPQDAPSDEVADRAVVAVLRELAATYGAEWYDNYDLAELATEVEGELPSK